MFLNQHSETVILPCSPLRPTLAEGSALLPGIKPKRLVRHGLKSTAHRLPVELRAAMLSANWASASFARFRRRSANHLGVACCLSALSRNPRLKTFELTTISGLSRRGLHKAFRTHLDCTPGVVLIVLRLRAALNFLIKSRLPISTIAIRCGYRNSNSLYVAFYRYLGVTPLSVRKRSFRVFL